jgi:hypothetical protein
MRRILLFVLLCAAAVAQTTPPPQTPRQALLELLKPASAEQVDKHLPEVLLKEMATLPPAARERQHQSMMMLSLISAMSPKTLQMFDSGPVLVQFENPKDSTRVEVTVDRDDLTGDVDAMEFGIRVTKDGIVQELPFTPRVLVDMKQENGLWKLARIGGSASLQLDDPKVAKLLVEEGKKQVTRETAAGAIPNGMARTANIVDSLRILNSAEATYAATYPDIGFTCTLTDLGGSLSGKSPDEHAAQLINPTLEGGRRYGYRVEILGCGGTSAKSYQIVASPLQKGSGHAVYCTDQSGVVKSVTEEHARECVGSGVEVK